MDGTIVNIIRMNVQPRTQAVHRVAIAMNVQIEAALNEQENGKDMSATVELLDIRRRMLRAVFAMVGKNLRSDLILMLLNSGNCDSQLPSVCSKRELDYEPNAQPSAAAADLRSKPGIFPFRMQEVAIPCKKMI